MNGARRVVVTGMEAICAAGVGWRALWEAARAGRAFGARMTRFDVSRNRSQIGAEIHGFDPVRSGLPQSRAARMDRVAQLCVCAARTAVAEAGIEWDRLDPGRAGVCIGTAIGGVGFMEQSFLRVCRRNGAGKPARVEVAPEEAGPHLYPGFLAHSVSNEVALDLGFTGVCTTMATGCTAGLDAVGMSADLIAAGLADVVVTGGADAPLTPIVFTAFDNIGCLTSRNADPSRASRPFDRERDGFLLAEGCGILVLEAEEHARRRGAEILGVVAGFASLSNAYHMTGLPADGAALAATLRCALAKSRIPASDVDYINAHGSSTQQNDRNETAAFKTVFGERSYRIPISSTKSMIGHTLGAASALESIICVLALRDGVVPPTVNYETPCPDCDLDYVPNVAREARLRVVECNASGFSGIHTAMLFAHPCYAEAS